MWIKLIILCVFGICFGMVVSGGVFTVLIAVGLLPRFAGKTDTARYEVLYEEFIIAGTVTGCIFSIFDFPYQIGRFVSNLPTWLYRASTVGMLTVIGLFSGMFVGCLALAAAEMLDAIPIFTRRIGFRHGLGIIVVAIALGKLVGALLYFTMKFF